MGQIEERNDRQVDPLRCHFPLSASLLLFHATILHFFVTSEKNGLPRRSITGTFNRRNQRDQYARLARNV